ncbi:MAG TPA: hypothetical protein VD766_09830 [Solirubrobacterales bacterium]|nr:hypothetical protein [Solirubrobacterales bacterium]
MRLRSVEMPGWPPLAWLALCGEDVELRHGSAVEVASRWAFEGAWAGRLPDGDFDQAAVLSGSGVRIRDSRAVFASPTSTIDRLCHMTIASGEALVSNSLLAVLESAGAEVTDPKYHARATSIVRGVKRNRRSIESTVGKVGWTHFRNVVWDGRTLARIDKPAAGDGFADFATYRRFLADSFEALAENMCHRARRVPLTFLGTVSSGYDANAATALAAEAGCRSALAFLTTGRSHHPDSGVPAAQALGVEPIVLERESWRSKAQLAGGTEVPFLAAGGGSGLIEFHGAQEHLSGTVLVTGFYGDSIWNPDWDDLGPDIVRKDASGLGFCEYRLHAGFVNCAPTFWAAREVADVVSISRSAEMEPWRLGRGYDRPVPRRIAEEAGVPREAFGHAKRAVPKAQPHRDRRFLMPSSKRDYFQWLRANREEMGDPRFVSPAADGIAFVRNSLALRAHVAAGRFPGLQASHWWERRRIELKKRRRRPTPLRRHAVAWALHRGKDAYRSAAHSLASSSWSRP